MIKDELILILDTKTDNRFDLKIYVPDESVDAYKAATNWVAYEDKIIPISQSGGE